MATPSGWTSIKVRSTSTVHLSIVGSRLSRSWLCGSWHPLMNLLVLLEMVRSHELAAALITSMRSIPGVYPHMSSKLIRTEERPSAAFPTASIGLLPCVFELVTHEVGAFGVRLSTVVIHAEVRSRR
jgi:hypothetical protein